MATHKPPVTLNPTWRLFTLDRWRAVRKVSGRALPHDRSKGTQSPFFLPAALTHSKEPIHHYPLGLTILSPDSMSPVSLTLSLWLPKWNKCPLESYTNPPYLFHFIHCAHLWLCCSCQKRMFDMLIFGEAGLELQPPLADACVISSASLHTIILSLSSRSTTVLTKSVKAQIALISNDNTQSHKPALLSFSLSLAVSQAARRMWGSKG